MSRNFTKFFEFSGQKSVALDKEDDEIQIVYASHSDDQKKQTERFSPYNQKDQNRRKIIKHSENSKDDSLESNTGGYSWYMIHVPNGKSYGRDFILKTITSKCKAVFTPYNFQFHGHTAVFCVKYDFIASAIRKLDRKIIAPDGYKIHIYSSKIGSPAPKSIDSELLQQLKISVLENYSSNSRCLNISRFHKNQSLETCGLYVPLRQKVILQAVAKIIKESIPKIEVLNISNNDLHSLEATSSLGSICNQLRSVNLQNNRIRDVLELKYLKDLHLDELFLSGNPLCDNFKDKPSYISDIQEILPMLKRLDGHECSDSNRFDWGLEIFPVSKKNFFPADEVKDLVIQFLDLYFSIYDSIDRRTKLLDPYHDQASFSLHLSNNAQKRGEYSLDAYSVYNRNLLTVYKKAERFNLLKKGKLAVVNALHDLPQTDHDTSSFSVDIFHVSPGLMSFSVLGVFKEVGARLKHAILKTFYRTFVVVPQGSGFVIVNETLFIDHASTKQQSKAFQVPAPTRSASPTVSTDEKNAIQKRLLVLELSKQTKMNSEFSTKCLEENDWDLQKSLAVFMKFLNECKLPPEAFITM